MGLNNAKHIIGEIDGIRCTIVGSGISMERAAFLRQLLEFNNYEVKEQKVVPEDPAAEPTYTVGVTDLVFNPVFAVYDFSLKTPEGGLVTPGYWLQECIECNPSYWLRAKKPGK
jgi:hypothetical protein